VLRLRTLERLGGAERIVATHLDAAMDKLAPRERAVAAALFRQLVTPSGAKIAQRAGDLAAYAELPEAEVTPVLERLTRESRILQALDGSRYEIYHDALAPPILEWQRRWELRRARRLGRRRVLAMLVLAASWLVLLAFAAPNLELSSVDLRFRALGSRPDPRVVVVGIDDKTFGALRAQWPFDRRLHARVISRLRRAGARVIAYDVQFIEPSSNAAADNALLEAVRRSARAGTPVVLATSEAVAGRTKVFGGSAGLAYSHGVPAYSGQVEDRDGAIRHMRRRAYGLETLPVVTAGLARGRPIAAAQLPGRRAWIDFRGAGAYRTVSFADVVRGRVPRRMLRGKIVVVGGTAPALQDVNRVATSDAMAGPEVAANEISTALDGFPLHDPPRLTGAILTLAFGVAVLVAALRFPLPRVAVLAAAIAVLYGVVAWFAFPAGVVLPVVYPLAALVFATIAMLFVGGLVVRGR
jgi:CHASE2 domain-containing sensor protein